jgi:hypothetical protein
VLLAIASPPCSFTTSPIGLEAGDAKCVDEHMLVSRGRSGFDRARRRVSRVPRLSVGLVKPLAQTLHANSQLRMAA